MFVRQRLTHWTAAADSIGKVRHGRISVADGQFQSLERHLWSSPASIAQVWWASHHGRLRGDVCTLDFHVPRGLDAYVSLDYVRSGVGTRFKTFVTACRLLDEIALLRGSLAIVAHVTNDRLSDRFLKRMGWQQHLHHWRGRHFIRRFDQRGGNDSMKSASFAGSTPSTPDNVRNVAIASAR